jgi:hypothetical protein
MKNSLTKEKALIISHPHPASTPKGRDDIFAKMLESEMFGTLSPDQVSKDD